MTLQQLLRLYILQKNHHQDPENEGHKKAFMEEHAKLLAEARVVREYGMAPSLFKGQPDIPFVLLKPKAADPKTPRPLIVHTHGGPHVYMDKDQPHAEIAYFLSQGYVVVCPNYRGSTGYPKIGTDPSGWELWQDLSKNKHHKLGPDDVFTVAKCAQQMPFVDPKKVFLRGASFGSFINAHLLAGVKKGIYENIFRGAHFTGGLKYPVASAMPDDIPLLITHSTADNTSPFADARIFMEKLLLKELAFEVRDVKQTSIQVFIATRGDHHLIDPRLELGDENSQSFRELTNHLEHSTGFIEALSTGKLYQPEDCYDQYKMVMDHRVFERDISEDVLQRIHAYRSIHPDNKPSEDTGSSQTAPNSLIDLNLSASKSTSKEAPSVISMTPIGSSTVSEISALGTSSSSVSENNSETSSESIYENSDEVSSDFSSDDESEIPETSSLSLSVIPAVKTKLFYGPTLALIKLQLGEQFTGDIQKDLRVYLTSHFAPVNWSNLKERLVHAGRDMVNDEQFFDQMVDVIRKEEAFLKDHTDHMVTYHTAEYSALHVYCFIQLWINMLLGKSITKLTVIEEMRLYDFMKTTFDHIDILLHKMHGREKPEGVFNNIPGFADRVIAGNPSPFSNAHSTAACSGKWFFDAKARQPVPAKKIIAEFFKILGIYSEARVERYLQLFEQEAANLEESPQALLQQMFEPYEGSEQSAYMCQVWGEEFAANDMELHSPEVISDLIENPELFEQRLRQNKTAFTNFRNCPGFGDTDKGFNYANTLQIRKMLRKGRRTVINSYFRNESAHHECVERLRPLIEEDFADYLAVGLPLPEFILAGAEAVKKSAYSKSDLAFFTPNTKVNLEAFYKQQEQLYNGLVQNPSKEIYGGIVELDAANKTQLQMQLRSANSGKPTAHKVYAYSLCTYLKGYTYYDLLKEAANEMLLNGANPNVDNYAFTLRMVNLFSTPASVEQVEITLDNYRRLATLLRTQVGQYNFKPLKHSFIRDSVACSDEESWTRDLESAVDCVLRHANVAKDLSKGDDIEPSRVMSLY